MRHQKKEEGGEFKVIFFLSLLLYAAGLAADNLTTWYALTNYPGELHEANPKTAALIERYGMLRGLLMDNISAVKSDVLFILAASISGALVAGFVTDISRVNLFIIFISLGFLGVGLLTLFQGSRNALLIMSLN